MSGRPIAMLAGVAALAILIAGCGGGDDTTGEASSGGAELTRAEYIKQADAACSKQNEQLSAAFNEFAESHKIANAQLSKAQGVEFSEEVFLPYVEGRIEILEGLNPPAADAKQVEAIVAATEKGLVKAKKELKSQSSRASEFEDPFAAAESLSRAYGLEVCGET